MVNPVGSSVERTGIPLLRTAAACIGIRELAVVSTSTACQEYVRHGFWHVGLSDLCCPSHVLLGMVPARWQEEPWGWALPRICPPWPELLSPGWWQGPLARAAVPGLVTGTLGQSCCPQTGDRDPWLTAPLKSCQKVKCLSPAPAEFHGPWLGVTCSYRRAQVEGCEWTLGWQRWPLLVHRFIKGFYTY